MKVTRSTREYLSPCIRVATKAAGAAMRRFLQANAFPSPSRHRKTSSLSTPTTTTRVSPSVIDWPRGSPVGKKAKAASAPRRQTGAPASSSLVEKRRPRSIS